MVRVKDIAAVVGAEYSAAYIRRRAGRGIVAHALHPNEGDVRDETYGKEDDKLKRFVRYLPPDIFHAAMIMIYDFKVAMVATKEENFGFIIESKEFSNTLRAYFGYLWKLGQARTVAGSPR